MESRDYELILDSLQMTGIYVIREDNHRILYFNRRVKEVSPHIELGMVCHEVWKGSCANCPLLSIGSRKESRSINYDDPFGKAVDIVATRILWEGRIPAFSIAVTPHADAASYIYDKIGKVNLTADTLEIVQMGQGQLKGDVGKQYVLTQELKRLADEGNIFADDVERFRRFTGIDRLREEFRNGKNMAVCTYRCRIKGKFRWHTMEIVPAFDYSDDDQRVMLYVKDVHDEYRKGLELEEANLYNQEIIKSLGEMNFGVFVIDLPTGVANPARVAKDMEKIIPVEIMGWDELLLRMTEQCVHPDDKGKMLNTFSCKALRGMFKKGNKKKEISCKYMLGGAYRYVSVTAHFYKNNERRQNVVLAFQDVDERRRREIKYNQSDRQMAAIIKSTFDIMNTVYLDTGMCKRVYMEEMDGSGKSYTGNYEHYIKSALKNNVHREDAEGFKEAFSLENLRRRAAEVEDYSEQVYRYRFSRPELRWIEWHIFFIRQDSNVIVNILGRDITREKEKEEEAIREKQERSHVVNSMSRLFFAAYYIDLEQDTLRMVKRGIGEEDMLGEEENCTRAFEERAESFVHPGDRKKYLARMNSGYMKKALNRTHPLFVMEFRRKAGKRGKSRGEGWIRATVILSAAEKGKPQKALYVEQDVTESKRREEREHRILKEACDAAMHANASKSEFLSRMSHDIRTPMNAIIGMTAIAGTHLDDSDRVSDCLNKITVSSKHLLALINEVLDMSKIESGKIDLTEEEFNLSDLVQNVITMIRPAVQAKQHELVFQIARIEHEDVVGDAMRLQQVFMNILGNAVKYTPSGGRLEIEMVERNSKSYGYGCYEFVFTDNGIGMSEEFLKKIFEPFSRAEDSRVSKIEGSGLGMAIAMNIVHMMNGDITIESKEGEGSKFTVMVFLKQHTAQVEDMEQFIDLPVLVVDDDESSCETACAVLSEMGMKGEWVTSGREAVRMVCEAQQAGEDYYAVILDWKMPDMDGIETAKAIRREAGDDIPIIILSAYDWSDVELEARQAGINGFISKPLFKSRLSYLFKKIASEGKQTIGLSENLGNQSFDGKRILLVEDNEINREIAEEIVGCTGAIVESVENGKLAVDKFLEMGEGYYDLIFMDIQMPVMNGYDASRAIRAAQRKDALEIPIIAMTANAFAEDIAASREAGMNEHISKPLNVEQLMKFMDEYLNRKR